MKKLNIITPVKNSIDLTLETIKSIMSSNITVPFTYTVYNDNSTPENTTRLEKASKEYGFILVNVSELTKNPSPNYRFILQLVQKQAIAEQAGLLIIESDVVVEKNTIQTLFDGAMARTECGMAAAVTVDNNREVNYPYEYAKKLNSEVYEESRCFSFCCTLLTLKLLRSYSFDNLNQKKDWHDADITKVSIKLGYKNYLFMNIPVLHQPHSSRPWRTLKENNILKYYWLKYTKGFDHLQ